MKEDFFKFPSTPHLATMPGVDIRGDKVLTESERDAFLTHEVTVEEKVDGANMGLSFDAHGNIRAQNRGAYLHLPCSGQWKKLGEWLAIHSDTLFEHLSDRYILFGEWCYAQHSIFYDRLPDWFLAFDIYDREAGRFLATARRDRLLYEMHIPKVPGIARGRFTYPEIQKLLLQSKLTDQPAEGIYLRIDHGDWLEQRAKLVRPAFIQAVEQHWSRSAIRPNRLTHDIP
ncbi:RNA ligase family protein [Desulfurispirillum indicum]|uniref:RNA ligase family protein n=1 Tax=Desulfurispirillum indicum TaxID=936456 RepID=UPI001CFB40D3|nr:RNA ligase family protein [Desulfurispirillum indicum]UCZ57299.1 RNA ligase family protein [Desulfurispirillum indicum]